MPATPIRLGKEHLASRVVGWCSRPAPVTIQAMTSRSRNRTSGSHTVDPKRIIAVLGMHRGGTSTAMRALACLGVDPGNDLLAGAPDQNPLGFFEDEPLLEICSRVLERLGTSWDSPKIISKTAWQGAALDGLELEAIESIRARFDSIPIWGFKNPRLARLLPFWQRVFKATDRRDSYLITLRNPLSVSRSLEARNTMTAGTAHLLWLLHMTDAMVNTRGRPRICVDYDALLATPEAQLERVASALDLPRPADDPEAFEHFTDDFLREDLRTTRFAASDLALEPDLSALAARAYELLRRWAHDDDSLSARQLQRGFQDIHRELQGLAPVFAELHTLLSERDQSRLELIGYHDRIHLLQREALERDQELVLAQQQVDTLEDDVGLAQRELANRDSAILVATRVRVSVERKAEILSSRLHTLEEEATASAEVTTREREAMERNAAALLSQLETLKEETAASTERVRSVKAELTGTQAQLLARVQTISELEQKYRLELRGRDAERAALRRQSEQHQQAATVATQESDNLKSRLRDLEEKSDERVAAITAQQHETIEWLHRQTTLSAIYLKDACQGLRASWTWRLVARIQRATEYARRRKWIDGSAHLQHLIGELHAQSQLRHIDVRCLARIAGSAQVVLAQILGGRIFRVISRLVGLTYLLRFKQRPAGPVELLRHRVGEVAFFLQQLSDAPIDSAIESPQRDPATASSCVDVIIPVYDAREETLRCLDSVLRSENQTPFEIIVIDDAGHDRKLQRSLEKLSRDGAISLIRNESNLGFPGTVNLGLALHVDRDVVILNSDTLVHGAWLDRLRQAALGDWNVATVTPFTNHGEICSYPMICQTQPMPSEEDLARLDDLAARSNDGLTTTLPTAVGFCMYIRRPVLNEIGDFDATRFRRGYGEENDFCLRARAHGYRNLLAANVFVGHEGGSSFRDSKQELIEKGLQQLRSLHPGYEGEIHRFIAADPIRWLRRRMDIASLASDGAKSMLMVTHEQGGGTNRHVLELSAHLEREGTPVFLLKPASPSQVSLTRFGTTPLPNLTFDLTQEFDRLVDILRLIPIGHIHIHHLLGFHPVIRNLPRELRVRYDVTLHDYFTICPRVHLVDDRNSYCELPDAQTCTECIHRNGGETGFDVDVAQWRMENSALLTKARCVYTPSHDVQLRLEGLVPGVAWRVRPHPEKLENRHNGAAKRRENQPLRVAVIGAIGLHKGAAALLECATDASKRNLPIKFHVIGFTDRDEEMLATGKVSITGAYAEEDLQAHLARARCHIAMLPSVWPETFCYTLSAAIHAELYPVAFDLGAIAERIRALDWGKLLPLGTSAAAVNDCLLDLEPPPFPAETAKKICGKSYGRYLRDYYDNLEL